MECMEARALKSSFILPEISMKLSTNPTCDDFWCVTGAPGAADDFSVDHFFDLPIEEENSTHEEGEEQEDKKYLNSSLSVDHSDSLDFSPELAIPVDDIKELELWSHLMDDSIPECPNLTSVGQNTKTCFLPSVEPGRKPACTRVLVIPSAVPHKPRSKRPRIAANRSKFLISPLKTEFLLSSSPSSPVSTLSFFPGSPRFLSVRKPALKKQKKKPAFEPTGPVVQRRCSHCQVTKTPQWRAGPTGPKSLCNACGVRFKSGRLFPEYRPACSPTFSSEVHSNSHRKVLEMRRKREPTLEPLTGSSPTSMIFGS